MSLGEFLGFAGIAVSGVFGVWGVYLVIRRGANPARLSFVCEQSLSLMEDFVSKLPNLMVNYQGIPIDSNLILISGYLVNDGSADITEAMTEQDLRCVFPEGSRVLEFQVRATAPDLKINCEVEDDRSVVFRLGLFRRDESFSFQALVSVDPKIKIRASKFSNEIIWRHRIASLGAIKSLRMPDVPKNRSRKKYWIRNVVVSSAFLFYVFSGVSQLTGLGPFGGTQSIIHKLVRDGKYPNRSFRS